MKPLTLDAGWKRSPSRHTTACPIACQPGSPERSHLGHSRVDLAIPEAPLALQAAWGGCERPLPSPRAPVLALLLTHQVTLGRTLGSLRFSVNDMEPGCLAWIQVEELGTDTVGLLSTVVTGGVL